MSYTCVAAQDSSEDTDMGLDSEFTFFPASAPMCTQHELHQAVLPAKCPSLQQLPTDVQDGVCPV